jgi:hypothetical protein
MAAIRYRLDDFQPYLYKTHDYGKTWTKITTGIPDNDFTRVIRADPVRRGLLYAGTETHIYVSFDDGAHWQSLKLNLPAVPIHDLVVKDDDLVVATHGRSFWILDDLTPLRQLSDEVREAKVHLFAPRPTVRFASSSGFSHPPTSGKNYRYTGPFIVTYVQQEKPDGKKVAKYLDAGQNPPDGVIVHYHLREKPEGTVTLTFLTTSGQVIRTFSSEEKKEEQPGAEVADGKQKKDEKKEPRVPKEAGANRFVWDMRYPSPTKIEGYPDSEGYLTGPLTPPGTYQVQLSVDAQTYTAEFEIRKDRRITATQEDLQAQFDLLMAIRDKVSEAHNAVSTIRNIRRQVEEWERRTKGQEVHESVLTSGKQLKEKLSAIEEELFQVKAKDQLDVLDVPIQLSAKIAALSGVVASADTAPTSQVQHVFEDLSARLAQQLDRLHALIDTDVAAFNKLIREAGVPAVIPVEQQ